MVSVKTLCATSDEASLDSAKMEIEPSRPSVDLVCVIDNSGSMSGGKIENLKKTLEFLLEVMDSNDRISLITFNSSSTILSNLVRTTDENKLSLQKTIASIFATGGTDITRGMNDAFKIL